MSLEKLFEFETENQWDYENGFYITSHVNRISKLIAHYELYKSIIHLPGHLVECGVYKGASLIRFATFRDMLESPHSRKIIGFDAFGKFPRQQEIQDDKFIDHFEGAGGDGIDIDELKKIFSYKNFQNYELVVGDILDTLPRYVEKSPELKISFLHIDVDVYKPSLCILNNLFDRVVAGGVVVFDDYGTVPGETTAVDEFMTGRAETIEKLPIAHIPSFVRKK